MSQGSFVSLPARESLDVTVGRRVHMIMWERRITQTALGRMVGIDQSSLGKRLRGERGWSLDDLRVVAEALNVSKAYLLGEEGHEDPDPQTEDYQGDVSGDLIHVDFRARSASAS